MDAAKMTAHYWVTRDEDELDKTMFDAEIKMLLNVICFLAVVSLIFISLSLLLGYPPFAFLGIILFLVCFVLLIMIASVLERESEYPQHG